MKVLVTGGAGFVGATLVPLLLARGHAVTVLDTLEHGGGPLAPLLALPGFTLLRGSILDPQLLERAVDGCDAVVHLAALVGAPACAREPQRARELNVAGTRLVAAAAGPDRPLVLASTGSCYGAVRGGVCREDTPLNPVSEYGRTKAAGEAIVRERCRRAVILRFATGYGLSPRVRLDLLVNDFVHRALREPVRVYEPDARRSFLHVRDMARAIGFALERAEVMAGLVYNVGDEAQNLTKRQVCSLIGERVPGARFEFHAEGRDPDRRDYEVSYGRLQALGFRARIGLADGIDELARALSAPGAVRDPPAGHGP